MNTGNALLFKPQIDDIHAPDVVRDVPRQDVSMRIPAFLPLPSHSRDNTIMRPLPVSDTKDLTIEAMQQPSEPLICRLWMNEGSSMPVEPDDAMIGPEGEVSVPDELILMPLDEINPSRHKWTLDLDRFLL